MSNVPQTPRMEEMEGRVLLSVTLLQNATSNVIAEGSTDAAGWTSAARSISLDSNGAAIVTGSLQTANDQDVYKFTAVKSGTMAVGASGPDAAILRVNLYNSSGTQVANGTASSSTTSATLNYSVMAGQTYYAKVLSVNPQAGRYSVGIGMGSAPVADAPPVMQAIAPVSATAGRPINFTVQASDSDGKALTYSAANLPSGAFFDAPTRTFSWTPTSTQTGTFNPIFSVSDGYYLVNQTASIAVSAPAVQPADIGGWTGTAAPLTLDSTGAGSASSQIDYSGDQDMFKFAATKSGAMTVTGTGSGSMVMRVNLYDANNVQVANATASNSSSPATLEYNVTAGQTYYTKIFSTNTSTGPYQLAISTAAASTPVGQAPVMSAISPVTATAGTPISFVVNATDPDGDTLTYSAGNLPSGSTFNTSTRTFSWTPTSTQTGTFSPIFSVSDGQLSASQTASIAVNAPSGGTGGTTNNNQGYMGQGHTGPTMIDKDGDGYGVGSPLGPDANDSNASVTTYSSALAKYGSVNGILNALGYNPSRILYVSNSGSNSTGVAGDINHPFADWNGVKGLIKPGDAVIYRAGTYTVPIGLSYVNGTASAPIDVMGMPGEKVTLDTHGVDASALTVSNSSYINVDNFISTSSGATGLARGMNFNYSNHLNFKNIETKNHFWGMTGMQDLHYITLDSIISHDNQGEHGIYLGSRELPSSNITVKNSLMYNNAVQGFQFNGRVSNLDVSNNVIYNNGQVGIHFLEGVSGAHVTNNLVFNNGKQQIVLYKYNSTDSNILPYDMNNNVFENNTIWADNGYTMILFNDATSAGTAMSGNVFRNNIIENGGGGALFAFSQAKWAPTTTIQNNVLYRFDGGSMLISVSGTGYTASNLQSYSSTWNNNRFGDPKFVAVTPTLMSTPSKLDFDLLSSSPAINAGALTGAPTWDLRYTNRVGAPDIGAYEYIV